MGDTDKLLEVLETIANGEVKYEGEMPPWETPWTFAAKQALPLARQLIEELGEEKNDFIQLEDSYLNLQARLSAAEAYTKRLNEHVNAYKARLSSAEERIEAHAKAGDVARRQFKRVEEVVEAANQGTEYEWETFRHQSLDTWNRGALEQALGTAVELLADIHAAVRRYEEGHDG